MTLPPERSISLPRRIWLGLRDPIGYLTQAEADLGDVVALRQGRTYAVFAPEHIKHVLQDNAANYEKGVKYRSALGPIMGEGIFTSEGAFWLRQRRLAQGAFHKAHMATLAETVVECAAGLVRSWETRARQGEMVDLRRDLVRATLRMTLRTLFNVEPDLATLAPAVEEVTDQIHLGAQFLPLRLPAWVPTPSRRRFRRGLQTIDQFVYAVIAARRQAPEAGSDLVGLLMHARDETTGEQMSTRQLRDELVTMLVAGHDTVTDAIVWTLILLAQHPDVAERVRDEIRTAADDQQPTLETMSRMELLGRVIHESLRLYPVGWAFARTALADDTIGGYRIPAGALVAISPYVMHRSRRYWEDPLRFDPDRFLPERAAGRSRFVYFPFGGGQRQCIGQGLATIEIPLILAAVLQRGRFDIPNAASIVPSPRISLRPRGTVWMKLAWADLT